jgi:hypothetical protein
MIHSKRFINDDEHQVRYYTEIDRIENIGFIFSQIISRRSECSTWSLEKVLAIVHDIGPRRNLMLIT